MKEGGGVKNTKDDFKSHEKATFCIYLKVNINACVVCMCTYKIIQ